MTYRLFFQQQNFSPQGNSHRKSKNLTGVGSREIPVQRDKGAQSPTSLSSSFMGTGTRSTNTNNEDLKHSNPPQWSNGNAWLPFWMITLAKQLTKLYVCVRILTAAPLFRSSTYTLFSQTHCSGLKCPLDGCAITIYSLRNFVLVCPCFHTEHSWCV